MVNPFQESCHRTTFCPLHTQLIRITSGTIITRVDGVLICFIPDNNFVKRQHITPTLRVILHCLPVRHRITYKIATMAFRCVRGACPAYFTDVCIPVEIDARLNKLRSARHGELMVPPTRTETFRQSQFPLCCPHRLEQSSTSYPSK